MRILTFLSMAVEQEIPYATIEQDLKIPEDQIEEFVIDGKWHLKTLAYLCQDPRVKYSRSPLYASRGPKTILSVVLMYFMCAVEGGMFELMVGKHEPTSN